MKQSAVEWFYQRILSKDIKAVFEQAKEMEKKQIIDAGNICAMKQTIHNEMIESMSMDELFAYSNIYTKTVGEQYYNETFNNLTKTQNDTIDLALESVDLISKAFISAKKFKNKL